MAPPATGKQSDPDIVERSVYFDSAMKDSCFIRDGLFTIAISLFLIGCGGETGETQSSTIRMAKEDPSGRERNTPQGALGFSATPSVQYMKWFNARPTVDIASHADMAREIAKEPSEVTEWFLFDVEFGNGVVAYHEDYNSNDPVVRELKRLNDEHRIRPMTRDYRGVPNKVDGIEEVFAYYDANRDLLFFNPHHLMGNDGLKMLFAVYGEAMRAETHFEYQPTDAFQATRYGSLVGRSDYTIEKLFEAMMPLIEEKHFEAQERLVEARN